MFSWSWETDIFTCPYTFEFWGLVPVFVTFQGDSTVYVFNTQTYAIWKIVFSKLIFDFSLPVQKADVQCYTKFSFVVQ